MSRLVPAALTGGALLWLAAVLLAPLALTSGSMVFAAAASMLYEAASFVCHQRPERSFQIGATEMPVCARCLGLYASGAIGAAAAWTAARGVHATMAARAARVTLALAAIPTALTWGLESVGVWQPGNVVRMLAAFPLGAAAGWIFVTALLAEARPAFGREAMRYHA